MYTPLQKISLRRLLKEPIMLDANILMVGIDKRGTDPNCSFENMKSVYMIPLLESFRDIRIHRMVYDELDVQSRDLVDKYSSVMIVNEEKQYLQDPQYITIFNHIADHERIRYSRGSSKDRGEVYSLAYAAYHGINYFSSKEIMVDEIARDLEDLKDVDIITFDVIVLLAFVYHMSRGDTSKNKALKSIYKRFCEDVIKRHHLPPTLREYYLQVEKLL
ncbi:MAG: hypothetical protein HFI33_10405 [Lachnospiraceae bacterium]|nr:hypothetical protein [Lachnospiraceae bacterium]